MSQEPKTKDDIDKIIKQLEGVYKTTKDEEQHKRVGRRIVQLKRNLEMPDIDKPSLEKTTNKENSDKPKIIEETKEETKSAEIENTDPIVEYESLHDLKVVSIQNLSKNKDVNFFTAILNEFEDEFWPALSEYHLKLDYNHSKKRDAFFDKLEISKITLKELLKVFEQLEHSLNAAHEEQLNVMLKKQEREFIMKMVDFLSELRKFLKIILDNHDEGGNVIIEPKHILKFDKLYGDKKLSNTTVLSAIQTIYQFVQDALDASGFASFYKKGEQNG